MKEHRETAKMISDIIKYLKKNPVPLNKKCVWLVNDESTHIILSGSDKELMKMLMTKYSLRYGLALELLHELYHEDRIVSWRFGDAVEDRNFFIAADGNTTIQPKGANDEFTYCTKARVCEGEVLEVPVAEKTKEAPELKCISTKKGFIDTAGFVLGDELTDELMDKLFPEEEKKAEKEENQENENHQ